ncbi:MAG: TetR family transcriptional regulator [Candidatus Dadabacteria bacterium]|nr:TetR family transcriptional regulator [Candidatus Dadabacteria bacterium]
MGRRNDHSHDKIKQMAIDAGRSILETKGFSGLSARNVAGEIGYTAGTLYNVFDNFTDLICHINSKTLDDLKAYLEKNLNPGINTVDAMNELGQAYVDYAKNNTHLWCALFEFPHPDNYQLPQWYSDKVRNLFELPVRTLAPMFSGDLKKAEYEARVLWGGVHGICLLGITDRLGLGSEEMLKSKVHSLITNYMAGLNNV